MNSRAIDPASPVPLYHQIAEAIRRRIEFGELAPGDALEPLREAARIWGVNLHTVRHAYTALAREGLVESRGPRGTRVTGAVVARILDHSEDAMHFVDRVVREARERHGLDVHKLTEAISRQAAHLVDPRPVVHVVECSAWQCEAHAREIADRYHIDAREWSLERGEEPPPGVIVATYFHYNDIRRFWPHRLHEVRFVTIVPDPDLVARLPEGVKRVFVCERDEETADTVAADLSVLLAPADYRLEPVVSPDPASVAAGMDEDAVILVAPRMWAALRSETRTDGRILPAEYIIAAEDLTALGEELGWSARPRNDET